MILFIISLLYFVFFQMCYWIWVAFCYWTSFRINDDPIYDCGQFVELRCHICLVEMAHSKPLLIPWLRDKIDSGKYQGVSWTNAEKTEFSIPWKHGLRGDSTDTDVLIFKVEIRILNILFHCIHFYIVKCFFKTHVYLFLYAYRLGLRWAAMVELRENPQFGKETFAALSEPRASNWCSITRRTTLTPIKYFTGQKSLLLVVRI